MPRDRDSSSEKLSGLFADIYDALVGATQDYFRDYGSNAHLHRPNTKADIIRDHAVDRLRTAWADNRDVRIRDENNTTYFSLYGEFEALVKKADDAGQIEFSKTQLSFDFKCNDGIAGEVTNICLSYVPNLNNPLEPSVAIVCPGLWRPFWVLDIPPPAAAAPVVEITPVTPVGPEDVGDDLVRVPAEKKEESEPE